MEIIEVNELKNGRVRIRLDDGTSFLLYKKEAGSFSLKTGDCLAEDDWQQIHDDILIKRARKRAMFLLQKMERTEKQLWDKLKENGYPTDVIEDAISYVKSFHYVDDERYAANYVRNSQTRKSKVQIKMDLMQKGVSKDYIEEAIEEELETPPEEVIVYWLKKKHYNPGTADEGEKRRVYQFLLRKGFRSNEILKCMCLSEYE